MVTTVMSWVAAMGWVVTARCHGRAISRAGVGQYIHALQPIMPLMTTGKTALPLHIVGRFDDPHTGAERSLPDLAGALKGRREVCLWSDVAPHPYFLQRGVRLMTPEQHPVGGDLLIGGVHVQLGEWLAQAQPQHVNLRYNLPNHQRLFDAITRIRDVTDVEPELIFVSQSMQLSVGLPGRVEPSLIRIDPFLQAVLPRSHDRPLTIGRMSRDVPGKHSPEDPALYRMLAARGFRVRVMGGMCLQPWLQGVSGVELLPVGAEPAPEFLASLDVFFYRTGSFIEPYGRVVMEAMASGLVVVAAANGGFAEQITQGVDGFLVQQQEQSLQLLQALAQSAETRATVGQAARQRAVQVHGAQAFERTVRNYLG